jgi:predicted transcriptional regulator
MSFLTQPVTIPMWFLIMMNIVVIALLGKLFSLVFRYRRGDISKEEHDNMVVWKVKTARSSAVPKKSVKDVAKEKEREDKQDLVQALKILLQEGDKGVMMQTIADRMGTSRSDTQRAMQKLAKKNMVEEVVGVSGTKYYLTQEGLDYCRRKAK